ncbi:MAG: NAD-dependent epimerase/dehydratase family protein [Thermoleophilaceae bacterium]
MRFTVTGAAGFIGSHLAERLLADGHEVIAIDSFTDYYDPALKEENAAGFDVIRRDLATDELSDLIGACDGVFHLAAQPGVRASWGQSFALYTDRNLLATQRVFEAAADAGVRVAYASSSSIYGDAEAYPTTEDTPPSPISPYGVTKLATEQLARAYESNFGLDVVVLRYFTVYGPRQRPDMAFTRVVNALRDGARFDVYGDGSQSRDVTYVGDAVSATVMALERAPRGAVYNVGGGTEASLNDVIEALESITGARLDARFTDRAAGDVKRTAADTSRLRGEVGWRPETSLQDGLAAHWRWASERVPAVR